MITIEIPPGMELTKAASYACGRANCAAQTVNFNFNGVHCLARPNDDPDKLVDYIWKAMGKREIATPTGVERRVCDDIAKRQQKGLAKYGITVEQSTDDMLQHAYEEALDLAVYLKAEIEKRLKEKQSASV